MLRLLAEMWFFKPDNPNVRVLRFRMIAIRISVIGQIDTGQGCEWWVVRLQIPGLSLMAKMRSEDELNDISVVVGSGGI